MGMLRGFIGYLLVGQLINWGTVFFVILSTLRKCRGRDDVLNGISERHPATPPAPRASSGTPPWLFYAWRAAVTCVLWPRNVVNLLLLWRERMRCADALLASGEK